MNWTTFTQVNVARAFILACSYLAYFAITIGEASETQHMAAGVVAGIILLLASARFIFSRIEWIKNSLPPDEADAKFSGFANSVPNFFLFLGARFVAISLALALLLDGMGNPEALVISLSAALAFYNPL